MMMESLVEEKSDRKTCTSNRLHAFQKRLTGTKEKNIFKFHLEIKFLESKGRVERQRIQFD